MSRGANAPNAAGSRPAGAAAALSANKAQAAADGKRLVETAREAVELVRYVDGAFSTLPLTSSDEEAAILAVHPHNPSPAQVLLSLSQQQQQQEEDEQEVSRRQQETLEPILSAQWSWVPHLGVNLAFVHTCCQLIRTASTGLTRPVGKKCKRFWFHFFSRQ